MSELSMQEVIAVSVASIQMHESHPAIDKMIRVYVKIRDARAERKKLFEEEDKALVEQQEQIENAMLEIAQKSGATQLGSPSGTAYIETETQISIADDSSFYKFIKDTDSLDMLQRRVSTTAVKQYIAEHEGAVPPGLNLFNRMRIKIRRK